MPWHWTWHPCKEQPIIYLNCHAFTLNLNCQNRKHKSFSPYHNPTIIQKWPLKLIGQRTTRKAWISKSHSTGGLILGQNKKNDIFAEGKMISHTSCTIVLITFIHLDNCLSSLIFLKIGNDLSSKYKLWSNRMLHWMLPWFNHSRVEMPLILSHTQEAFLGLWQVQTLESRLSTAHPNGKSRIQSPDPPGLQNVSCDTHRMDPSLKVVPGRLIIIYHGCII